MKATWKTLAAVMLSLVLAMVSGCKKEKPEDAGNDNGGGNTVSDVRVTTHTPQEITATTALCGCDVIVNQGVELTEIGVCWSTQRNPTVDGFYLSTTNWEEPFVCTLTGLEPETQYYVRAYALRGQETHYGVEKSFITEAGGDALPFISVMTGDNFITGTVDNPTIIDYNDENAINLKYGFHMESNPGTMKELYSLSLTLDVTYYEEDGPINEVYSDIIDLTGMTSYDYIEYLFEQRGVITLLDGTITAVVTDVDNQSDTASIAFTIQMLEAPLIGSTFEWIRKGVNLIGNTEEEMAAVGLKWTGSYKEVFATIEPLNDNAVLYLCNGDDFDAIDFESDKYAYFTNLVETTVPIEKYRNITISNSADYNDMLAVVYGDDLNLIRIKRAEIEIGTFGTQVTILGEIK